MRSHSCSYFEYSVIFFFVVTEAESVHSDVDRNLGCFQPCYGHSNTYLW